MQHFLHWFQTSLVPHYYPVVCWQNGEFLDFYSKDNPVMLLPLVCAFLWPLRSLCWPGLLRSAWRHSLNVFACAPSVVTACNRFRWTATTCRCTCGVLCRMRTLCTSYWMKLWAAQPIAVLTPHLWSRVSLRSSAREVRKEHYFCQLLPKHSKVHFCWSLGPMNELSEWSLSLN